MSYAKATMTIAAFLVGIGLGFAGDHGALAKSKTNLSGTINCYCSGGQGSCEILVVGGDASCSKGKNGTCNGTCKASTTTSGLHGGAAKGAGQAMSPKGAHASP